MSHVLRASLFVLLVSGLEAQWLGYPTPGIPRTRDGKPNLAARAPRARDGKPDLSGVWHVEPTTREEWRKIFGNDLEMVERTDVPGMELTTVTKYAFDVFLGVKPEDVPLRPEGKAIQARRGPGGPEALPSEFCLPISYPLAAHVSEFTKIVQTPGLTIMLMELDNTYRQIYTDGRPLPKDPSPSWYGYSVGRWEGDTFVVETNGLNDKGWLDIVGHPRSEAMRMTERYRRRDFGHMDVEITFDDPKLYTKPFSVKVTHLLQPDSDVLEDVCAENERDKIHTAVK
jgi:hypothetical protein